MADSVLMDNLPTKVVETTVEYRYTKQEARSITERFNKAKALLEASGVDLNRVIIVEGK